jgi:hypothetical protein
VTGSCLRWSSGNPDGLSVGRGNRPLVRVFDYVIMINFFHRSACDEFLSQDRVS